MILLTACSTHYLDTSPTYTKHKKAEIVNKGELQLGHILFIADNQKAFLNTESILEQSQIAEVTVNTAHRRAALDEFSLDVVDYIQQSQQDDLLIHVGDMLNNSCVSEFKLAVNQFKQGAKDKPWFVAPGNHDGFYLGISSPTRIRPKGLFLDERSNWAKICTDIKKVKAEAAFDTQDGYSVYHENIMDKFVFVQRYVEELGLKEVCRNVPGLCKGVPLDGEYHGYTLRCLAKKDIPSAQAKKYLGSREKYFVETCWTDKGDINKNKNAFFPNASAGNRYYDVSPWYNFVIQKIMVPNDKGGQSVIIMDTSSYLDNIATNSNGELKARYFGAADNAYISELQATKLLEWIKDEKDVLLIGHHPVEDLRKGSKNRLAEIADESDALMYISGDTHNGFDVTHHLSYLPQLQCKPLTSTSEQENCKYKSQQKRHDLREANLGSTIDAPLEYAKAGFTNKENRFVLQRFSLTPIGANHDFKEPFILAKSARPIDDESGSYIGHDSKLYLSEDKKWKECIGEYFPDNGFNINLGPEDPLGLREDASHVEIAQTKSYLWLPHAIGIMSDWLDGPTIKYSTIIHKRNIAAYKINRLIRLVEVYKSIYGDKIFNTKDKKYQAIRDAMNKAYATIKVLDENTFSAYLDYETGEAWNVKNEKKLFHKSLKYLSALIQEIRTLAKKDTAIIKKKKLCSALFEAERERRPRSGLNDMGY